jgi:hypothetical protein
MFEIPSARDTKPPGPMTRPIVGVTLLILALFVLGILLDYTWLQLLGVFGIVVLVGARSIRYARRLVRGESIPGWDERQVRNNLVAGDLTWILIIFVTVVWYYCEVAGWVTTGWWFPVIIATAVLGRIITRWILNRCA